MISAIVLAAGHSRRMGTQKLLLPFRGKPMIATIVDELLGSPVDEVIVVTGKSHEALAAALVGRDVRLVVNTNADSEMLQSVRCGLHLVNAESDAVIVALGDQPTLTAAVVGELIRAYQSTSRDIVVPVHKGKRGHPLLVSTQLQDEIFRCHDGRGLRGLLDAHAERVLEVEIDDANILKDIDLPVDYDRAITRDSAN